MYKILAINPGSTSTKIAVYEDEKEVFIKTLRHSSEEISKYEKVTDQFEFRKDIIVEEVRNAGIDIFSIDMIVGRGGLIKPIPSGVYEVNEALKKDLVECRLGEHASNLGGLIAADIASTINKHKGNNNVKAVIVDPVVVDEMQDVARISGHPLFHRISIFHALNQKAVAKRYAKEQGRPYDSMNLIVVHMGGGVSVGAHHLGKVIDVFNALDGDGAFSPERAGAVQSGSLIKMCFSGKYTEKEVYSKFVGKGGFNAYCGTNDMRDVEKMVNDGDAHASEVRDAFVLQVAKDIGSMSCVLKGQAEAIVVTGGIAYDKAVVAGLKERCEWIAPFTVYPGEDELLALTQGALRVMNGEEKVMVY